VAQPVPSESLIIARLTGGLGNQLFIYAAARHMAKVRSARLMVDSLSAFQKDKYGAIYQLCHFAIAAPTAPRRFCFVTSFGRRKREFLRNISSVVPLRCKPIVRERDFGMPEIGRIPDFSVPLRRVLRVEGYWQSAKYFQPIAAAIRQELAVTSPLRPESQRLLAEIRAVNAVAVHVRIKRNVRLDTAAAVSSSGPRMTFSYYERAIALIAAQVPDPVFFCFGDDPEWLRTQWPKSHRARFVTHNASQETAYEDIALMAECRHFVIGNSTFSWWGAWLSRHPEKIVVAPRNEAPFTWASEPDVLPPEWHALDAACR
jgi:hypothetical protein